jgi:hypothetical protein
VSSHSAYYQVGSKISYFRPGCCLGLGGWRLFHPLDVLVSRPVSL